MAGPGAEWRTAMIGEVPMSDAEFELLRTLVYQQAGIHLRDVKRALLRGRLMRRLRQFGYSTFAQYYEHLKRHDPAGTELQEMINAVTTNKTSFFRERHHFDFLRDRVLAPARQETLQGRWPSLRIWSAGCSSGEEPYSIAITMAMTLGRLAAWDVKILASDIDTKILDAARTGIYAIEALSDIPRDTLKQYFLKGSGRYAGMAQVKPDLRNIVRFARINLMDDSWPFRAKFDAIFCRNVIIYFDRDSQRRLLQKFSQLLKPGGFFFAGHSENLFWLGDFFQLVGRTVYTVPSQQVHRDG